MYVSKVTATDLADMILDVEKHDGGIRYGVLDSSLWHNRGDTGPSLAEQMIMKGCRWRPSDRSRGSRVAGKNELHRRFQVDEFTEKPRLVFMDNCTNTIAQIPSIPLDKRNPEDVDTNAEDHLYDALRYGVMTRPRSHSIWGLQPCNTAHRLSSKRLNIWILNMAENDELNFDTDEVVAAEDTTDSIFTEASSVVGFVQERFRRSEDSRRHDEDRWLRAYRNYRGLYGP